MSKYSATSRSRLSECHPDLILLFESAIKLFDHSIICGHRGKEEQNKAFGSGNTKLQFPQSKHNKEPSLAVDAIPYPIDWNDTKRIIYFAGFIKGLSDELFSSGIISHKVRWGGDWSMSTLLMENKFNDLVHFELVT